MITITAFGMASAVNQGVKRPIKLPSKGGLYLLWCHVSILFLFSYRIGGVVQIILHILTKQEIVFHNLRKTYRKRIFVSIRKWTYPGVHPEAMNSVILYIPIE